MNKRTLFELLGWKAWFRICWVEKMIFSACDTSNLILEMLKHDKISGGGTICISVPHSKFWGSKFPRPPVICAHANNWQVGLAQLWQRDRATIEIELLFSKTKKSLSEPPFGGLKGNIRTPSIARWKARIVDFIFVILNFFRYLLRLRRYERKSVEVGVFERAGSLWAQISEGTGITHQPLLV